MFGKDRVIRSCQKCDAFVSQLGRGDVYRTEANLYTFLSKGRSTVSDGRKTIQKAY